jgi:uncharacterized SAM-binding protein YcdF (DUF218 family)
MLLRSGMGRSLMQRIRFILRSFLIGAGLFFIAVCIFALTTGPFYLYHWLGTGNSEYHFRPEAIIVLGGSPIPGEQALIRAYYARKMGERFSQAKIYIAQLSEEKEKLYHSAAWQLGRELTAYGIDSLRLHYLLSARSTREEALQFAAVFPELRMRNCVLITSPEHMMRAIESFRKAGFNHVGGEPTFSWAGTADYRYKDRKMGGRNIPVEAGHNLQLRYQFWNHLRYQLLCYRELIAFGWYRLRGWV